MSETPEFVGQKYTDTNTGNVWNAASVTPGDWTLQVQDPKAMWEPTSVTLYAKLPFVAGVLNASESMDGITSVTLQHTTIPWIFLTESSSILSFSAPLLTDLLDGDPNLGYGIVVDGCVNLTTLSFPVLATCENPVLFNSLTNLVTVSFPALVSIPNSSGWESFNFSNCVALTDLSIPSFIPENSSSLTIGSAPLTAACVNHILARHVANPAYVTGSIFLSGAAPTGQGIADKATLIGRGVSVTTN